MLKTSKFVFAGMLDSKMEPLEPPTEKLLAITFGGSFIFMVNHFVLLPLAFSAFKRNL